MSFLHAQKHVNVVAHMALNDRVKKMFTILRWLNLRFDLFFFLSCLDMRHEVVEQSDPCV